VYPDAHIDCAPTIWVTIDNDPMSVAGSYPKLAGDVDVEVVAVDVVDFAADAGATDIANPASDTPAANTIRAFTFLIPASAFGAETARSSGRWVRH
jgi:hypothetical protein